MSLRPQPVVDEFMYDSGGVGCIWGSTDYLAAHRLDLGEE